MSEPQADEFLVRAVQSGDADAWRDLISRYEGRLLSFARRRLADRAEAEDLVQETFMGLMRSVARYDTRRPLESYLFAILRNKLTDHFRKRRDGERRSLDTLGVDEQPDAWIDADTPSRRLEQDEQLGAQQAALAAALRSWVEHCRQNERFHDLMVIEMLVVLGLRNKEVAADLEMTETAVAGVKFRVLEQWRKLATAEVGAFGADDADLAATSTVARVWRDEGVSCPKRSTLGRHLLGVLDEAWASYVAFHVDVCQCDRCRANLDDLQEHDARADDTGVAKWRERVFASSVGFLSKRPDSGGGA